MTKLIDYQCMYTDFLGITMEYAGKQGLKLPDLYQNADDMVKLALIKKKESGGSFCKLPFDTCIEAENLGGIIKYDESPLGPRKQSDLISSTEEVLNLPAINPEKGRMAEVLNACSMLKDQGERVALEIRGIFDILNSLMDIQKVFMTWAMKPDLMKQVCDKIRKDLITYFLAAEKAGCDIIFYSDSSAGLKIIGPRSGKKLVEWFTYPLMTELMEVLSDQSVVHLCPKTAFMLAGCGKARWVKEEVTGEKSYIDAYLSSPNAKFTGQRCNKNLESITSTLIHYLELV